MVKNVFILDEHLKTDKVLTINGKNAFFDDLYTLDLSTGTETYEFSTTITEISESNYVMFYYHGKYKLFQIVEIEQEHDEGDIITTVYAEAACLELLNNVVRSFEGEFNVISFLNHVLEGTGWSIGEYSSSLAEKVVSVKVDKTTQKWACIQDYMGNFGYEISPYVIYNNGHVKSKMIDVYSEGELGERTYKRFEYGYNVTGMVKKKDLYDWCTALIIDTDKDITNITCNGNGYVKAANSDVILATNENRKYNLGREYIYSNFDANGCNDGTDAVAKALEELKRRATPRFDYECTTALTYEEYELLNLGDTVYCIDNSFNPPVTLEARVGKLELSFTDRTKCRCTLTNYKEVKNKINMELTGNIQEIINSYFPVTGDNIANGAITDGKIDNTYYEQITADIVNAGKVVTEELIAKKIMAVDAKFDNLETIYAKIENLNATNANITNLNANIATIQTLINGHLTSDNIQSLVLTSDKVTIANALIKDAHIESVNASKVNAGTINTNNVSIQSNDGSMLLQGNLQQFKDKDGNIRIQIGKDATGNFTFSLFDATGTGVLIDETGIKQGAIANGLIVNAMVSDTANISGSKLDISSVISSINANENTLLSSKIKFSDTDQTLDVAFNQLKTKVETIENVTVGGDLSSVIEQVNTNTTNIGIAQGQISSLISNTTITKQDGTVTQLKDEYNSTKATVNSNTTKIGSLETNYNKVTGDIAEVTSKQATLEQNLDGFKTTVSNTYATQSSVNSSISSVEQTANKIEWLIKSGTSKSDMMLTDELFNLVSNNINIEASNINLEGYTTINGDFSVDANGTMTCTNANINGALNSCTINSSNINSTTISGGSITIGNNFSVDSSGNLISKNATIYGRFISETLNGTVEANDGMVDLTSYTGDYELLLKPIGIFHFYNNNNLFIVDGQNKTITLGSSSSVNSVDIGYNSRCYFGNNYWTRGTLTMNQTSQGVQGGTQTYLSGTGVSATKIYQNGSMVTGSDIVLKDNIKEYKENALDIISKTKVYSFNRIVDSNITEIGFIAQQVPNELLYKKGDFTEEELGGLTAEEKVKLLAKKTKEHIENEKIKFYEKLAEKYPSFRNLDDKSAKAQIDSIQEEINELEFEAPISMINQNNIIGIMFKAIQELKSEIDKLKKVS